MHGLFSGISGFLRTSKPRRRTPNKFFNSLSKRDPNHLLHLPGSFSLLRRFGVQFYTERSCHPENGVKARTAFAGEGLVDSRGTDRNR